MATLTRRELDTLDKFEFASARHVNCVRYDARSKGPHREMVRRLCEEAVDDEHNFLTRARLQLQTENPFSKDRLVADFVDLTTGEVVEVAVSESKKSLDRKEKIYNKYGLRMLAISG